MTVTTPVAVPCKTPDIPLPALPLQQTPANASLFDETKAALIEIDTRKAYEAQIEAALKACQ